MGKRIIRISQLGVVDQIPGFIIRHRRVRRAERLIDEDRIADIVEPSGRSRRAHFLQVGRGPDADIRARFSDGGSLPFAPLTIIAARGNLYP